MVGGGGGKACNQAFPGGIRRVCRAGCNTCHKVPRRSWPKTVMSVTPEHGTGSHASVSWLPKFRNESYVLPPSDPLVTTVALVVLAGGSASRPGRPDACVSARHPRGRPRSPSCSVAARVRDYRDHVSAHGARLDHWSSGCACRAAPSGTPHHRGLHAGDTTLVGGSPGSGGGPCCPRRIVGQRNALSAAAAHHLRALPLHDRWGARGAVPQPLGRGATREAAGGPGLARGQHRLRPLLLWSRHAPTLSGHCLGGSVRACQSRS